MKYILQLLVLCAAITSGWAQAFDNPHFYRATNMFLEPRLEHDYLTTFNATIGGGSTTKGRNSHNTIVPLLDIYGPNTVPQLGADITNLSINSTFRVIESNLSLAQNLVKGFFFAFYLPVRSLTIKNIAFDTIPLSVINTRLAPYGINADQTTSAGAGDLTSYIGWTHNYQETETIDFIDMTLMTGFLAPTGKTRNENKLFSLPTGYNGHWGVPLCAMLSIGCYEWVTVGASINALFFAPTHHTLRLRTDEKQSGIIKLDTGCVLAHKGSLLNTGLYFKADHFGHGFSFTAAYSFALQQSDRLSPKSSIFRNISTVINSDTMLKGWNMHTINIAAEYDFTKEDSKVGNRIGLFYNLQFAGKRTFNTNIIGGTYGIDIGWYM